VLTLNSGSSSLKFAVFEMASREDLVFSGSVERIGLRGGRFYARDPEDKPLVEERVELPDHDAAIKTLFDWLQKGLAGRKLDAVGHRVVHGGVQYCQPCRINPELIESLEMLVRLAPEHLPHEIKVIQAVDRQYPTIPQVACFDTSFHRRMPDVAQRIPLPRSLWHEGVRRYGFHGLSYEYILHKLAEVAGPDAANGRLIVAHLGNGSSMAAIHGGRSLDTTMGLTPAGGLVMGTRSGDLDPGVLVYLLLEKQRTPAAVDYLVNQAGGLIGVSACSSDMRDLLQRQADDAHAAQAIELYCYQAKKFVGALATVLGGLDTFVFTAGIGAGSAAIRARICQGLEFLGIRLDPGRNDANEPIISCDGSPVAVRVMKTNEESMIARHTCSLLNGN
jgi:acetate kinase